MTTRSPPSLKQTNESAATLTTTSPATPAGAKIDTKPETTEEAPRETLEGPMRRGPPRNVLYKVLCGATMMLLVLFWANASWIIGKIHDQSKYAHRLHILAVDLDGGDIGSSVLATAASLNGEPGQATWDPVKFSSDLTYDEIYEQVRAGNNVWGALIANPGASDNLSAAIGDNTTSYTPSSAVTLLYNEARHRTVELAIVYPNLAAAAAKVGGFYQKSHGATNIRAASANPESANWPVILQPIAYAAKTIVPFTFSSSVLLNTVMFVFPALSQFFLVLTLNGVLGGAGAYGTWPIKLQLITRAIFGTIFPFLIGISWAGWAFIFSSPISPTAGEFFAVAGTVWLFATINFHVIDGMCALVEMRWMPFFVFSWIITQVSATVNPIELASVFYRVDYVLPSHHVWGVLMTIFGHGANNHLKINLTVCFAWLIIVVPFNTFGNIKRWKLASGVAKA